MKILTDCQWSLLSYKSLLCITTQNFDNIFLSFICAGVICCHDLLSLSAITPLTCFNNSYPDVHCACSLRESIFWSWIFLCAWYDLMHQHFTSTKHNHQLRLECRQTTFWAGGQKSNGQRPGFNHANPTVANSAFATHVEDSQRIRAYTTVRRNWQDFPRKGSHNMLTNVTQQHNIRSCIATSASTL